MGGRSGTLRREGDLLLLAPAAVGVTGGERRGGGTSGRSLGGRKEVKVAGWQKTGSYI